MKGGVFHLSEPHRRDHAGPAATADQAGPIRRRRGDHTPFARRRFGADVLQLQPRLVVIMIGINNTWDLDVWWEPSLIRPADAIAEEIVGDSAALVEAARDAGMAVALGSILPTGIPLNGNTPARNRLIAQVNERLRGVAQAARVQRPWETPAISLDLYRQPTEPKA